MLRNDSPLLTDLYQLSMVQSYLAEGLNGEAVFELFVRRLPAQRGFLLAAGLEMVIDWLEKLRFDDEELDWLARHGGFDEALLDYLATFRFRGGVDAVAEGTVVFADEPLVRVTAPLPEAQLVESRLLNLVQFQTVIASKAARCVLAAGDRRLVDFGMRRAHGAEAALHAARAAWIAGFDGTSHVAAGKVFGLPLVGTMAHSFVLAHDSEKEAFLAFARTHPDDVTLLIDTYDTEAAARLVADIAPALRQQGSRLGAVRIDSGDLGAHAFAVREILDRSGLESVRVLASGGIDEHDIADLLGRNAPIDGFGVGTSMVTSADAPALDCAYKLMAYAGHPRRKRSEGKAYWPGAKQVWRRLDEDGRMSGDTITTNDETAAGEPLLVPVMRDGRRLPLDLSLASSRRRAHAQLERLPGPLRTLQAGPYRVAISADLRALGDRADAESQAAATR